MNILKKILTLSLMILLAGFPALTKSQMPVETTGELVCKAAAWTALFVGSVCLAMEMDHHDYNRPVRTKSATEVKAAAREQFVKGKSFIAAGIARLIK